MSFSALRVVVQGVLFDSGWVGERGDGGSCGEVSHASADHGGWRANIKWAGNQEAVTFLGYRPIRS
jgi:hypothetical protein